MNLYLLVFLLLAAGTLLEWKKPQYEEKIYWICWTAAAACLCLRFGQGTDYVTYHAIYETIPTVIDFSKRYICGFYPEVGWRLLSALFKLFHAPFWVFTAVIGLAEMLLLHRFLRMNVPMKTMGLFMSYPVLYIVYLVSGLRQGLAMCLFLGLLVPLYLEKKWPAYIAGVLFAASFHKVGYAWLVLPLVYYLPVKFMFVLAGLSTAGGLILRIDRIRYPLFELLPSYHLYKFLFEGESSILAISERLLCFMVLLCYFIYTKKHGWITDRHAELVLKAYICGICFYMLMCGNSYYASRYVAVFKILECAVLLSLILKEDQAAKVIFTFFFTLTIVMGIKNMNAMISEGGYDGMGITVWNFPYVSILDQDKIEEYVPYSRLLEEKYQYNIADQQL